MAKRIRVAKQEAAPAGLPDAANAATNTAPKSKAATPSSAEGKHVMLPAFLSKTYEIFSMPEFSHVCGWNANGDTIIVSQLEAFVAMVLPRFFKHRNFPSFVRQLNLYGFHKTVLDSKRLEFQHPYFKRGRPDLLHHIKRKVSNSNHHNQQLVNSSIQQNSRLDAHREISDTLLREMKELRQRSDVMEKRLREVEIDNAIVRSDNLKLWKHLEQAKDKQLIMQEKMKKIMWILFQIYRGKQQNLPKLSGNDATGAVISEDCIHSSMLGPKEFRDVLRFLAMDEPPLLPGSTDVATAAATSRKRKFVEVPSDVSDAAPYKLDVEPSSVIDMSSAVEESNPFAMTVPSSSLPMAHVDSVHNNVLSIFSPIKSALNSSVPNVDTTLGGLLTNGVASPRVSSPPPTVSTPTTSTPTASAPTAPTVTVSTPNVSTSAASSPAPSEKAAAVDAAADANHQLAFLDEELPLLPESDHYSFSDGEQAVMKKLEDFETSLLDEYDVSCLDTLLQQLKNANGEKPAGISVAEPEEAVVGPTNASPNDA
ncbi:HSF-type DNA-binding [Phytophthora infestans]|uniref:HSF-type DNA-binding n=1 Tax=Phytophthora infestans TaxID=4787 RepID=A0A8S9UHT4_PHYIN|nr:HSF-type DNA-binding [Phytophthora infestans]